MKKIITIIILSLCFTTPSQANDIREFQVEGMSIGDSALDFFSETLIKIGTKNNPINTPNQKYEVTTIYTKKTENIINIANFDFVVFEAVEITYKKNDRNYVIKGLTAAITNERKKNIKNIEDCKKQKDEILNDISAIALTPNSRYLEVEANCIFYEGEVMKYYVSNVGVSIKTDEVNDWLHSIYK
jgi:hypothetical protein